MKKYKITEPVFEIDLRLITDCSFEEVQQWSKKTLGYEPEDIDDARGIHYAHEGIDVIWLKEYKNEARWNSVLVHELLHLVSVGLKYLGIPLSKDTEEVYAQLQQYFFRECFNKLNQK